MTPLFACFTCMLLIVALGFRGVQAAPELSCFDYDGDNTTMSIPVGGLPATGYFVWNGTIVTDEHLPLLLVGDANLTYVPVKDSLVPVTFKYVCSDEVACTTEAWCENGFARDQGKGRETTATISLTDTPDNPTAVNSTQTVFAGATTSIVLPFFDPDIGSFPASGQLFSMPSIGRMCPTAECLTELTAGSTVNPGVSGLAFFFEAPVGETDYATVQYDESFLFKVTDDTSRVSNFGTARILMMNPATAAEATVTTNEDVNITITLSGVYQTATTTQSAEITSLPTGGTISQVDGLPIVDVPTTVTDSQGRVVYTPTRNRRSSSIYAVQKVWYASNIYDAFNFSVFPDTGLRSPPATISLLVNPINDAPIIEVTTPSSKKITGLTIIDTAFDSLFPIVLSFDDSADPPTPMDIYRLTIVTSEQFGVGVSLRDPSLITEMDVERIAGDGFNDGKLDVRIRGEGAQSKLANLLQSIGLYVGEANEGEVTITIVDSSTNPVRTVTTTIDYDIAENPDSASSSQSLLTSVIILAVVPVIVLLCVGVCWWQKSRLSKAIRKFRELKAEVEAKGMVAAVTG